MPKFSSKSLSLLEQCHPDLQKVFKEAIKYYDFSVLDSTIRTEEQQKQYVKEGKSKTMNSKHLKRLVPEYGKEYSFAVDVLPYFSTSPHTDWEDYNEFSLLAGIVLGISNYLYDNGKVGHKITWGGTWGSNKRIKDNTFKDMPHFELLED